MEVIILDKTFKPLEFLSDYKQASREITSNVGAESLFIGTMRDNNLEDKVLSMRLEYYPEMTKKHIMQICESAKKKWKIVDVLVVHRVGEILPGQPIVMVVVWAGHRRDAYEANRYIMEDLKYNAPFWKSETLENGKERWVKENTPA